MTRMSKATGDEAAMCGTCSDSSTKRPSFWRKLFGLTRSCKNARSVETLESVTVEKDFSNSALRAAPASSAPDKTRLRPPTPSTENESRADEGSGIASPRPSEGSCEERGRDRRLPRLDLHKIQATIKDQTETFEVPPGLSVNKSLGIGAYGIVAQFRDEATKSLVAIKKVGGLFNDLNDAKRVLREVRLLGAIDHDNIIKLKDVYTPPQKNFSSVYIVTECMDMDLEKVIRSSASLTDEHQRWFTYQTLRGVNYLHSAGVVHRDLKPGNILVNKDCSLKICDFGLARGIAERDDSGKEADNALTEYVVTRWYRAPEVALLASQYGTGIDIWAIGCILCELVGRAPVFPGSSYMDQLKRIFMTLGGPSEEDSEWLSAGSGAARRFVARFQSLAPVMWTELCPEASPAVIEAIDAMVKFNPAKRVSAKAAILMPAFGDIYTDGDGAGADTTVDWSFDDFKPTKHELQRLLQEECFKYPTFGNAPQQAERNFLGFVNGDFSL